MTAPLGYIPDILEEHFEELQFLLARRPALARSRISYRADLAHHDERILAHLDGVLAVGEPAVAPAAALLSGDDQAVILAATFALAHLPVASAADELTTAFSNASANVLLAMADAFLLTQTEIALRLAESRLHDADSLARVASARVLARHRGATPRPEWLAELIHDPNPLVRQLAWRFAGDTGVALDAKAYADALRDEDSAAKREGMIAAARTSMPGILAYVRQVAEKPSKDHSEELRLLAVLGTRQDEKRVRYVATDASLGPLRFEVAGLYGAPGFVPLLLEAMRGDDPRVAIAAGEAFGRMTGVNVESNERVTLPPEDGSSPDEFDAEFRDEGLLPDAPKAQAHWSRVEESLGSIDRICGGHDASRMLDASSFEILDLETQWWQALRHQFERWTLPAGVGRDTFPART